MKYRLPKGVTSYKRAEPIHQAADASEAAPAAQPKTIDPVCLKRLCLKTTCLPRLWLT